MRCLTILVSLIFALFTDQSYSAEPIVEPPSVPGYLIVHGGNDILPIFGEAFVKISGGPAAKIIYIAMGVEAAGGNDSKRTLEEFKKYGADAVKILTIADKKAANEESAVAALKDATGIWVAGGTQVKTDEMLAGTAVEKELHALLKREGAIAGLSGASGRFLPGSIIDLHVSKTEGNERLLKLLSQHPGSIGFGMDTDTTLFAHGRNMVVAGGNLTVCLSPSSTRPAREEVQAPGSHLDLIALTRAAAERTKPAFPPAKFDPIELESGTLVIDGGGIPKDALLRFIQAAGGPDALILVVPTAMGDDVPLDLHEGKPLAAAGAKNLKVFHLAKYADAFDNEKIKILNEAKGIWFCGGRQWRYVDAYLDTPAEKLMHALLKRGGAIGGSSAGATIQGEYLVRGNPLGNVQMMSEGYERGLGFLKGVAIDQHFIKRNRFADMTELKKAFPQLLGLGIDEGAAVVVTGHVLEVVGIKNVCIYDKHGPPTKDEPEYVSLKPGEKYDLKTLSRIAPEAPKP